MVKRIFRCKDFQIFSIDQDRLGLYIVQSDLGFTCYGFHFTFIFLNWCKCKFQESIGIFLLRYLSSLFISQNEEMKFREFPGKIYQVITGVSRLEFPARNQLFRRNFSFFQSNDFPFSLVPLTMEYFLFQEYFGGKKYPLIEAGQGVTFQSAETRHILIK